MLEEGLETKSKGAPKTTDKSTTNKKKSSAMFCKPYFKDKDQKVFTVDVGLMEEIRIVNCMWWIRRDLQLLLTNNNTVHMLLVFKYWLNNVKVEYMYYRLFFSGVFLGGCYLCSKL